LETYVAERNLEIFPLMLGLESEEMYQQVSSLIENHLEELQKKIEQYFSCLSVQVYDWVRDPFAESSAQTDLQSDLTLKMRFTDLPPDKFWISVKEEYPAIHRKAINILLPF
jgi:hypothetical protein